MKWLFVIAGLFFWAPEAFAQATPVLVSNQATCAAAITTNDSADLPKGPAPCSDFNPKAIFTAGTGAGAVCVLQMALADATNITYSNVQPGAILPIRPKRIYATNTTCVGIVAFY